MYFSFLSTLKIRSSCSRNALYFLKPLKGSLIVNPPSLLPRDAICCGVTSSGFCLLKIKLLRVSLASPPQFSHFSDTVSLLTPSTTTLGSSGSTWHTIFDSEIPSEKTVKPQFDVYLALNCTSNWKSLKLHNFEFGWRTVSLNLPDSCKAPKSQSVANKHLETWRKNAFIFFN